MVAFLGPAAACAVALISSLFRWHEPGAVYVFAGSSQGTPVTLRAYPRGREAGASAMAFKLGSPAFAPGGEIPVKHVCDGADVSSGQASATRTAQDTPRGRIPMTEGAGCCFCPSSRKTNTSTASMSMAPPAPHMMIPPHA